jgi:hypothetical protein
MSSIMEWLHSPMGVDDELRRRAADYVFASRPVEAEAIWLAACRRDWTLPGAFTPEFEGFVWKGEPDDFDLILDLRTEAGDRYAVLDGDPNYVAAFDSDFDPMDRLYGQAITKGRRC